MLVTSQLPIQITKIFYSFFDVHLCPSTLNNVPPPMSGIISLAFFEFWVGLFI